jgi:hypothetical protein
MRNSTLIARLMGPVLLVIGIGIVLGLGMEGSSYSGMMKEFIANRGLIFLTGVLALTAGLAIVNAHNLWVQDWRVIITILGWLAIIRGILNIVFPAVTQTVGDRVLASQGGMIAGAAITVALGAVLTYMGYEKEWAQKRPARATASRSTPARKTTARRRKR